ncbi:MAG: carboxyl transferase, partial [Oscillospiraceae bacterium]|nr:carboxyl transferase [Oscillospiraceae bacterium]
VFTAFAGKNVSADSVIAVPDAVISPIAPLTAAEFLYHDKLEGAVDTKAERDKLAADFALNSANAFAAAAKGAVDDVADPEALRSYIVNTLDISRGKRLARRIPKKHGII